MLPYALGSLIYTDAHIPAPCDIQHTVLTASAAHFTITTKEQARLNIYFMPAAVFSTEDKEILKTKGLEVRNKNTLTSLFCKH